MDILNLTALELASAIKTGKITAKEVTEIYLKKIAETDGDINAFITVDSDNALKKAEEIDIKLKNGEVLGPLAGVPIAVKDNICTKNLKTTCASKMLADFIPPYSATVVEQLEKSGAIIIGKTNMDEFAMGNTGETSYFGSTKNPLNKELTPGGSSSGSAAAVASGQAVISLGSDTGGSIRQPAAFCGVTGFKPTYGSVSRYGLIAHASSLDQIGPIARDVKDLAAMMDIIAGQDLKDGTTLPTEKGYLDALNGNIKGLKIGIPTEWFDSCGLDSEIAKTVKSVAEVLKQKGAEIKEISLPFIDFAVPAYYIISSAEASSNLSRYDGVKYGARADTHSLSLVYKKTRSENFGDEVKRRIMMGAFVLSSGYFDAYYRKALKVKAIIKQNFDETFKNCDVILCPVTPTTPQKSGQKQDPVSSYLADIFTVSANIAGLPALSIPCGFHSNGMPIGAQFIGNSLCDKQVLNVGLAYQSEVNS